ncbi:ATP-binding protein [Streptomyces sp. MBT58]|uniref:ATP-binding protein n=2 Tax=Streptomyces TaxID=1883 RepID=UPI001912F094|nr:ATP-binding protein [Streptomyces sp. MBT58]MBK5992642.1 ATP-binding protein [Streptomyces sp. MBT58]
MAPSVHRYMVSIERSTPAGQPIGDLDLRRPAQLRRINCALLKLWGLNPCVDDAGLVVTELATNALQHGGEQGITVMWCLDGVHLTIVVRDSSPVRPVLRAVDDDSEGGRGLCIVEALAAEWGISEDGTTVHCALALPSRVSAVTV